MPYTKKKVHRTLEGVVTDIKSPKSKSKAKEVIDLTIQYRLERDRIIYKETKDQETINAIKEKYKI